MANSIEATTCLYEKGQPLLELMVILKGEVCVTSFNDDFILGKGDIIGLMDVGNLTHSFTYTAITPLSVSICTYDGENSLSDLLETRKEVLALCPASMTKQMNAILNQMTFVQFEADNLFHFLSESLLEYGNLCRKNHISKKTLPGTESIDPPDEEEYIAPWILKYYAGIYNLSAEEKHILFSANCDVFAGLLLNASKDIQSCLRVYMVCNEYKENISDFLLNENKLDFFDLYSDLYVRIAKFNEPDIHLVSAFNKLINYLETSTFINNTLFERRLKDHESALLQVSTQESDTNNSTTFEFFGSLDTIINYSGCEEETATAFKGFVAKYIALPDKTSTEDKDRDLYKSLTTLFHKIYIAAFQVSLSDKNIPTIMKLFFLFGYVDETLCGTENTKFLYSIADTIHGDPSHGIYTFYEWLVAIYYGKKEPSRNEFDTDFTSYLHELQTNGKIDKAMEIKLKENGAQRVLYELQNMFPLVNKITYGRVSNYTPLLSEHNILKKISETLVNSDSIIDVFSQITALDFKAFCRDVIYTNPALGINKEFLSTEILPDIILMPIAGVRGITWQEIEEKRRNTPARMMLPILSMADTKALFIQLTGEFRWEMCKRIQGSRWNDIAESSLTSAYFDYIQFYRKNPELSADAKEKIKLSLIRAKNSFKESFVNDYSTYILYEGKGLPKLNKVVRSILFAYCPFSSTTRLILAGNPLYADIISKYEATSRKPIHHFDLLVAKLSQAGEEIPPEITAHIAMLTK